MACASSSALRIPHCSSPGSPWMPMPISIKSPASRVLGAVPGTVHVVSAIPACRDTSHPSYILSALGGKLKHSCRTQGAHVVCAGLCLGLDLFERQPGCRGRACHLVHKHCHAQTTGHTSLSTVRGVSGLSPRTCACDSSPSRDAWSKSRALVSHIPPTRPRALCACMAAHPSPWAVRSRRPRRPCRP